MPRRSRTIIARRLRRDATDAERLLWRALRESGMTWKFRRQHPIGRHVADFACPARKLAIELDGGKMKGLRCIFGGRTAVRRVLFIAAQAAAMWNPTLKAFKQRLLASGKKPKVAIIAVMRKLVVTLNAMVRDNRTWQAQPA